MIDRSTADALAQRLTDAWNAGDADAFAAAFSEDADFVNVFGHHAHGRAEIMAGHAGIFAGVYRGSRNLFTVEQLRALPGGLALLHLGASLDVPSGPFAGSHRALMSTIVDDDGRIVALHNVFVREPAPRHDDYPAGGRRPPTDEWRVNR